MKNKMEWKDGDKAFEEAIASGRLSSVKNPDNYAGDFMYMGTVNGVDTFKHQITRKYLNVVSQ